MIAVEDEVVARARHQIENGVSCVTVDTLESRFDTEMLSSCSLSSDPLEHPRIRAILTSDLQADQQMFSCQIHRKT